MTTLRGLPLSAPLLAALLELVPRVDAEKLKHAARERPRLFPGMAQSPESIQKQVAYLASRDSEIEPWLCELLKDESAWKTVVSMLSEQALSSRSKAWAAYFGPAAWTLALLFDDRAPVQDLGRDLAGRLELVSALTRDEAAEALAGTFRSFLGALPDLAAIPAPVAAPGKDDDIRALERRLADAETRGRQLEKDLRSQQERAQAARSRESQASDELKAAKDRITTLSREKRELEESLEKARSNHAKAVAEATAAETGKLVRSWLAEPMALSPAAHSSDDLLERAEEALRRQAARDRASGERRALTARLEKVITLGTTIDDALAHALQPLPELAAASRDLALEVSRLKNLLGVEDGVDPIAARFLRLAASTSGWRDAARIRRLVAELADMDLIPGTSAIEVERRLQNRVAAALDGATMEEAARREAREVVGSMDPAWKFRLAVDSGASVRLHIDGHNLALSQTLGDALAGREAADPRDPERHRRTTLIQLVKRLGGGDRPNLAVDLWFDGADASCVQEDGIAIRFSGGTGQDRADDAIMGSLQSSPRRDEAVFLATSDRGLAARAQNAGVLVLPAPGLLGLLLDLPPR